jgi:hypothetical protein
MVCVSFLTNCETVFVPKWHEVGGGRILFGGRPQNCLFLATDTVMFVADLVMSVKDTVICMTNITVSATDIIKSASDLVI